MSGTIRVVSGETLTTEWGYTVGIEGVPDMSAKAVRRIVAVAGDEGGTVTINSLGAIELDPDQEIDLQMADGVLLEPSISFVDTTKYFVEHIEIADPFSPTSVAAMKLWLPPSSLDLTVADGAPVAGITDQSIGGLGATLAQATGSKQPLLKKNIINGRSVLRFDGVDDRLFASFATIPQPTTIFIVCTLPAFTATTGVIFDSGPAGVSRQVFNINSGNTIGVFAGVSAQAGSTTTPQDFAIWEFVFNGADSLVLRNGIEQTLTPDSPGTQGMDDLVIGSRYTDTRWSAFDMADFMLYGADVSQTNRQKIRNYLANRFQIATE